MQIVRIVLKNHPTHDDGSRKPILATKKQAEQLVKMRNNPDERSCLVQLHNFYFSPMDIAYMEETQIEPYEVPMWLKAQISKEDNAIISKGNQNGQ